MKKIIILTGVIFFVTAVSFAAGPKMYFNPSSYFGLCKQDINHGARIEAAISRIEQAMVRNPDGTVSINNTDPDYEFLASADETFANAVLGLLNKYVDEGMARVNPDFSVDWLLPEGVNKTSCTKHWWGEKCEVDALTTWKVCLGLEAGQAAMSICSLIPVVGNACRIIEVVGEIPLEREVCYCSKRGKSSTFHVTWIGAAWFSCN